MSLGTDHKRQYEVLRKAEAEGELERFRQAERLIEVIVSSYEQQAKMGHHSLIPMTFSSTGPASSYVGDYDTKPVTTFNFKEADILLPPGLDEIHVRFLARKIIEEFFAEPREANPMFDYLLVRRDASGVRLTGLDLILDDGSAYEIPTMGIEYSHKADEPGRAIFSIFSHHVIFEKDEKDPGCST